MSWWRNADSYGVFFNRDELKTRERADPPFLWPSGILAPRDPKSGGTWMAVTRHGTILALLNRWHEVQKGTKSRGQLIPYLADHGDPQKVGQSLRTYPLNDFPPFTLIAMDARSILRWDWDGSNLTSGEAIAPITSSSFRFPEVRARRRALYDGSVSSPAQIAELEAFHQESGAGAFSIRMCREDAQTWSRSRLNVLPKSISWDYLEEFREHLQPPLLHQSTLKREIIE
jgi:hypothetical protein